MSVRRDYSVWDLDADCMLAQVAARGHRILFLNRLFEMFYHPWAWNPILFPMAFVRRASNPLQDELEWIDVTPGRRAYFDGHRAAIRKRVAQTRDHLVDSPSSPGRGYHLWSSLVPDLEREDGYYLTEKAADEGAVWWLSKWNRNAKEAAGPQPEIRVVECALPDWREEFVAEGDRVLSFLDAVVDCRNALIAGDY